MTFVIVFHNFPSLPFTLNQPQLLIRISPSKADLPSSSSSSCSSLPRSLISCFVSMPLSFHFLLPHHLVFSFSSFSSVFSCSTSHSSISSDFQTPLNSSLNHATPAPLERTLF